MKFLATVALITSFAAASLAATSIINDITQKIAPQFTTLTNDLNGFPASGLTGALTIHTDVKNLGLAVDESTSDAKSVGSFSSTDGVTILADLSALIPTIADTFSAAVNKKADFKALPFNGVPFVLSDLQSLNRSVLEYANVLIAEAPIEQQPQLIAIKNTIASGFATAITAYSS